MCRARRLPAGSGRRLVSLLALALLLPLPTIVTVSAQEPGPKVGDVAPAFALPGSDGKVHRLSDHRGIRPVVLAWFPRVLATA